MAPSNPSSPSTRSSSSQKPVSRPFGNGVYALLLLTYDQQTHTQTHTQSVLSTKPTITRRHCALRLLLESCQRNTLILYIYGWWFFECIYYTNNKQNAQSTYVYSMVCCCVCQHKYIIAGRRAKMFFCR